MKTVLETQMNNGLGIRIHQETKTFKKYKTWRVDVIEKHKFFVSWKSPNGTDWTVISEHKTIGGATKKHNQMRKASNLVNFV